ncbi:hypothetical protein [Pelagibius marinus]|uniref:hypothetical protein n=1 Tax=Pelagibius marinus TaxID=2762760 RepID=UPI00187322E8|nr:hypothetical protein [Pelagibius marinus]
MSRRRSGEWSVVLFIVALLAFNPPVLSIFSVPELILGVPVLYLYIFFAWGAVIVLLALNVSGLTEREDSQPLHIPGPVPARPAEDLDSPLVGTDEAAPRRGGPED